MAVDNAERARRGGGRQSRTVRLFAPDQKAGAQLGGSLADSIAQFKADVTDKALRSGIYAGARLLYDELKLRTPVGPTGTLNAAVYHWHDDKRSVNGKQIYRIGVNKGKAPHWFNVEYGHWQTNYLVPLEQVPHPERYTKAIVTGQDGKQYLATRRRLPAPRWVPAHPYLRPTADHMPQAIAAAKARLAERIGQLIRGEA